MHNGWKFVSEPHIVYLEPEYEVGKSGRKSPASQSSLRGTSRIQFPFVFPTYFTALLSPYKKAFEATLEERALH